MSITLRWSVAAQTADPEAELRLPDLTVTAEDPLILLPPLGPPASQTPIAVPQGGAPRAQVPGVPLTTDSGDGPALPPIHVLRRAQAAVASEHTSKFLVRAGVADPAAAGHIAVAAGMEAGDPDRTVSLHLSGTMPVAPGPGELAARGLVTHPTWQLGLDGSHVATGPDHAWHAGLHGASGPVHLAFFYHRWLADPAAPGWQVAGAAELVWNLADASAVRLGLVAGWSELGPFAFPAMRLHYVPAPGWHLAAGARPVVGFPRRVADLVDDDPYPGVGLHPDRALVVWLGGGHRAIDLRVGLAHGLHRGADVAGRATRESGTETMLFGITAEAATAGGDVEMTVHAGGNWHWRDASWTPRLLATAEWHPAITLPVALLLRARWIESSAYTAIETDEDWSLNLFREVPGTAMVAGVRWSVAYGQNLAIFGGVHSSAMAADLSWGLGIEYARNIVRLSAAPRR